MADIKLDPKNYRVHGEKNKAIIRKSLEDCGAGRSILLDGDDVVIAGNGVYEQAQALGLPVRVIESDGRELIAIKRTDLKTEDDKRRALALADNHASDTSVFNIDSVLMDFSPEELDTWEFEIDTANIDLLSEVEQNGFKNAVNESSDLFTLSFALPKSMKEDVEAYIKRNGKDNLTQLIISEVCRDAEVK